jgi:hypothetical protein
MRKTKVLVGFCCFCFASAFALGLTKPAIGGTDPCCAIPCVPELIGHNNWGFGHWVGQHPPVFVCEVYNDEYNCWMRPGTCPEGGGEK